MKLKHKVLGFIVESNMFVGSAKETSEIGIVSFGDNNEHIKIARDKTDEILEENQAYLLLSKMSTRETYTDTHILHKQAHKTKTDMWTILFHKFLIEALENDGYKILAQPQYKEYRPLLTDNHIIIE